MIKKYKDGICVHLKEGKGKMYQRSKDIKTNGFFRENPVEAQNYESVGVGRRFFTHGLVEAIHLAFCNHNPIEIAPDHLWLMICQAVSGHEECTGILGQLYDLPKPKKLIEVFANGFKKGSPNNPWEETFEQFEIGIKKNIPETLYNLISNKEYSTTTQIDKICFTICMMDSLKKYFSYMVTTLCNIPKVYIKGKREDWEALYQNTVALSNSGLKMDKWFAIILPILQKFLDTFDPNIKVDKKFWNSIYKYRGARGSGGPTISGWIACFFPYLNQRGNLRKAGWVDQSSLGNILEGRLACYPNIIPNGINTVPFIWNYYGKHFDYNFYGGFLGINQCKETGSLSARLGWAVGEKPKEKKKRNYY